VTNITPRRAHPDVQHIDQIVAEKASRIVEIVNSQAGAVEGLIAELESIGQPVACKPGTRVLREGETGKGIYILRCGGARLSMASHDGKTRPLRELEPGSFIGLSSTLSCDHCCYTVEATGAAEFTFVPAEAAQELLRSRPDLCLQVIQLLGAEMSSLCRERTLLNLDTKPVGIQT
jgi:CRP-like cAMP-binding protein